MDLRRSRVLVVAAGLLFGLAVLWLRAGWLQVVRYPHYAARAERLHKHRVVVWPERGQILDRRGRALARDLLTYSVSAAPRDLEDPRAAAQVLARVLDLDRARLTRRLASGTPFVWVARQVPPERAQRVEEIGLPGVRVAAERRREYPLGPVAGEIIGRTDLDNVGIEGLELQLDEDLRGRPGWATRFVDGRGRSHGNERGRRRDPHNGRHVVLTLDAELQAIAETHLSRAVDTLDAVRGFALFLDPRTGEILAAVNVPHLQPGRARNWTVTDSFEPGSIYKVVTAGAALEEQVAAPGQWFEASPSGVAEIAPRARFHDVHKEPGFTFHDAMRWSSNIVLGKLGLLVGSERLYRYSTALGFGSVSGIGFPGEASGKLRSPARWSPRSCPTVAIGHEISVTTLQVALAYGAVANGGVLMRPMLVREIRDSQGHPVRRFTPYATRRVFGEGTTRILRDMLAAVVDSGTAKAARLSGLRVAGKTGTAQKYDAAVRTYGRGLYYSSFAGFAPAEAPYLVGVVVIDEPRGSRYYGGQVAAPVFRQILLDLVRLPEGPFDGLDSRVADRPPTPIAVTVPDLRLLRRESAERRLSELGLRVRFTGRGSRVVAQDPAAGEARERGGRVTAWLSAPSDSAAQRLPDVRGLPAREALRRLAPLEVRTRLAGVGVVVRQSPEPGTRLPLPGECRLWCDPEVAWAANGSGADEAAPNENP